MTLVMRAALARLQLSIMINSSTRLSLTGGQVGCTRKTSRPRMSSSILQKFSPSGNFPSVTSPSGRCRKLQIAFARGRLAWPLKIFSSRMGRQLAVVSYQWCCGRQPRTPGHGLLTITQSPHFCFHLKELVGGVDAEGFAGLEDGKGFDFFPFATQDCWTIREVILTLPVVVFQAAKRVQQLGAGKDVSAHVDFGNFTLNVGGIFFFDDARKSAGGVADNTAESLRIGLVESAEEAGGLAAREVVKEFT